MLLQLYFRTKGDDYQRPTFGVSKHSIRVCTWEYFVKWHLHDVKWNNGFFKKILTSNTEKASKHKFSLCGLPCRRTPSVCCSNRKYCPFSEASSHILSLANDLPVHPKPKHKYCNGPFIQLFTIKHLKMQVTSNNESTKLKNTWALSDVLHL